MSDILGFENRLKQKEDFADEGQGENSFARGFYYYLQQNYLVHECRYYSFKNNANNKITAWKSTGGSLFPDGAVSYNIYPTHIAFNNVDIYFECVNEEKYLVFALIDKNLDILENYKKLWDKIKTDIKN